MLKLMERALSRLKADRRRRVKSYRSTLRFPIGGLKRRATQSPKPVPRNDGLRSGRACLLCPGTSDVNLFRYCQGVIYFDAQVSDRAFNLGMSKQKLNGPEISGSPEQLKAEATEVTYRLEWKRAEHCANRNAAARPKSLCQQ
jgi:hypothetical protein